ncbi:MAG: YihY/virulence factor BrkB family protein [Acidimicrobiales bacterium]
MSESQSIPPQTEDKGEPDSPLDLPSSNWKEAAKRTTQQFKADRGTLLSAGMAFYWFLAIFPALLATVGITGLVGASAETVDSMQRAIESALPGDAARVLSDALEQATMRSKGSSVVATIVGIALALWSASAGMVALQVGLDIVYEVPKERPFVKKRLRAFALIGVFVLLGGLASAAIVFGQPVGGAIRDHLPFGGSVFTLLWTLARWLVGLLALGTMFAALYYLGPNRETPRWTWISPGGIVATAIWLLASLGFSLYVSSLGSYGETYGSLTGVVVLLMWLYLSAVAVLFGGEVNAELERQGEGVRRNRKERKKTDRRRAGAEPVPPAPRQREVEPPQAAATASNGYTEEWARQLRQGWGGGSTSHRA